jgi:3-oxoacyl-[acyl-carrier-protein] synthase-3
MTGIRSIGWWIPEARLSPRELARDYGLAEEAIAKLGVKGRPVAGENDHPSTMGARAATAALQAAGLDVNDLDLLIYAGVSKDWPAPWVAAHGVLHELGSRRAAGFDVASRCAGGIDALWLAKTLIDSGSHRTVAVCCAERFDHWLGPPRAAESPADAVYSAGAAVAIVSADARNDIAAFSCFTNPDLSTHRGMGPLAGGSRLPFSASAAQAGQHLWTEQLSIREVDLIARYSADADRHNYPIICRQAGFEQIDFVVCSPIYPQPQLDVLMELGVSPERTLFTIPFLGHIGPADLLLILGVAIAAGRRVGWRVVLSTRTNVYSNAIAIRGRENELGIDVAGHGLEVDLWRTRPKTAAPCSC